jgi:glycosyltransferase involved in cell wall biosynthesis
MKIAFVSQPWNRMGPPADIGSIAILTYQAALRLAVTNDVTIYARRDPSQLAIERLEGVTYRRVSIRWDQFWLQRTRWLERFGAKKRPFFASKFYYRGYISAIARDLSKNPQDVVQIFNFSQFAPIIRAADPKAKVVLRMSCEWLTQLDPDIILPRLLAVDAVFGCSEFITAKIRKAFPEYANRCRTILNGREVSARASEVSRDFADAAGFDSDDVAANGSGSGPRLLFVGRLSPEKGVHVLIEAFNRVQDRFPSATLDIIGPPAPTPKEFALALSDDAKLQALSPYYEDDYVARLKGLMNRSAASRINFRGKVPHDALEREYRNSDLLVFPSIWDEPSGNPPIEAMAAGVPVVSTRTGGTAEYVENGTTGLLVDPADPDHLYEAIVALLADKALRRRMGEAGRRAAARRFTYERFVEDLGRLYEEISGSERAGGGAG